jgi:hypothetical protein
MIRNLWTWLQGQMVQDVPETLAVCEFDCYRPACWRAEWERCAYRRWAQAIGVAQPAPRPPRPGSGPGGRGDRGRA